MTIDEWDETLSWRRDMDTGIISNTTAHKVGMWRLGELVELPQNGGGRGMVANILGRGLTQIEYRAKSLSGVQVGDFIMFQNLGENWIAVYEVEAI